MKYTINSKDIRFCSSSDRIEALRRALEIRSANLEKGICIMQGGVESYIWETPLSNGSIEVEHVTVCRQSGDITYSQHRACKAS